jgi:hypothetical protein
MCVFLDEYTRSRYVIGAGPSTQDRDMWDGRISRLGKVFSQYEPFSKAEKAQLIEDGKRLAVTGGRYYGPVVG